MFGKNRKKKVGICVMVVTASLVLAAVWAVLATPETALAKKPGGGGGGGDTATCVQFDGDGSVEGDLGNTAYCDDKKAKVSVSITSNTGHFKLGTSSSNKVGAGRGLVVDFGTPVTLSNGMVVSSTTEALTDPRVLFVDGRVSVGAFQESVDFNTMEPGETNELANLGIRLTFHFGSGATGNDSLLIRLAPNEIGNDRHCPSSDSVTVTLIDDGVTEPTSGKRQWRVETQMVDNGAGISRSGEGEFLDTNLLTDVNPDGLGGLAPGHIALSFGFTVTAAP